METIVIVVAVVLLVVCVAAFLSVRVVQQYESGVVSDWAGSRTRPGGRD